MGYHRVYFFSKYFKTILILASIPLLKELKFHRFDKAARSAYHTGDYSTALLTSQTCNIIKPEHIESLQTLVKSAEARTPRLWEWVKSSLNISMHPRMIKLLGSKCTLA